jgi:hypothetical protein
MPALSLKFREPAINQNCFACPSLWFYAYEPLTL